MIWGGILHGANVPESFNARTCPGRAAAPPGRDKSTCAAASPTDTITACRHRARTTDAATNVQHLHITETVLHSARVKS